MVGQVQGRAGVQGRARRVGRHLHGDICAGTGMTTVPGDLQQPAQQHRVGGHQEAEEARATIPAVERKLLRRLRELFRH